MTGAFTPEPGAPPQCSSFAGDVSTGELGRAFQATAASYKFFWWLAVLRLLPHGDRFTARDLLLEMVSAAWAPAALHRLSFGPHDRLQTLIRDLQTAKALSPASSEERVRRALLTWPDGGERLHSLARYVPSRFLAPWYGQDLPPSLRDDRRNREIADRSRAAGDYGIAGPYAIFGSGAQAEIVVDARWREWLLANYLVVRGFTEIELARFLQARNPHVPGIVDKLRPPAARKLANARRLFERARADRGELRCLYTRQPLAADYAVDHFIPRAFVAHDLIWNLAPAAASVNRLKADRLPPKSLIEDLAAFHFDLIAHHGPGSAEGDAYAMALGLDLETIRRLSRPAFIEKMGALLSPLLQIAESQGFVVGWPSSPAAPLSDVTGGEASAS